MLTFLGQARDLRTEDVNVADIAASKYIYVTGYLVGHRQPKGSGPARDEGSKQRLVPRFRSRCLIRSVWNGIRKRF